MPQTTEDRVNPGDAASQTTVTLGGSCSDRTPIAALGLEGNRRARFVSSLFSRGRGASQDDRFGREPRLDPSTVVRLSLDE
jgi:hypothetical protein